MELPDVVLSSILRSPPLRPGSLKHEVVVLSFDQKVKREWFCRILVSATATNQPRGWPELSPSNPKLFTLTLLQVSRKPKTMQAGKAVHSSADAGVGKHSQLAQAKSNKLKAYLQVL